MRWGSSALWLFAALPLGACAYWNTFYLARKNYDKATQGEPYLVEIPVNRSPEGFNPAITYSKKLIAQYPKSKWVDDAYLLWARSLLGKDDPLQTVNMLSDFAVRFPASDLKPDATFYLGVAYRQAHRPVQALQMLDEFLAQKSRHPLEPYALLERARVLKTLDRTEDASRAAGDLISRYPRSPLVRPARIARAEALFAGGDYAGAREDYRALGLAALDDEDRFGFLLREADCLEGARQYDAEIELLHGAISHEHAPVISTQTTATGAAIVTPPSGPGADHWGRLRIRVGTAHLLAGRLEPALNEYREVVESYPRSVLAAEAQYGIGYAWETLGEDFDKARAEYAKVREISAQGGFSLQATQRADHLDRLAKYRRSGGRDSLEKKAEAGFLLAELYLFQHGKPERAIEEYRRIEHEFHGTAWAGKAINAQAWVLSRKLDRQAEADSLYWRVIHEYRATEAQLAARDYLEAEGHLVPDSLIERPKAVVDTTHAAPDSLSLTPPPATTPRLGEPGVMFQHAPGDSALRLLPGAMPPGGNGMMPPPGFPGDSLRFRMPAPAHPAAQDSMVKSTPSDTTRGHP
ncbi:MAG: tetratricopeptide repeat protein [Candidatus Eisenbacteria bacterium]|nr:tetratricopeptide repeat protein [Candidatus Eisenbacteria bacterium]